MSKYVIFTDSTSDLTTTDCKQLGLWPEMYMQEITCYGDNVPYDNVEAFYTKMDNGEYPPGELKTSSSGAAGFEKILDHIIEQTENDVQIVYASTSPYISSSTVETGKAVLEEYREKYPNRRFIHINTHSVSGGQAVYMKYLSAYIGDNIASYAEDLSEHIVHLFTIHDMSYAAKSGRFNIWKSIGMKMMSSLKMMAWMYFPYEGQLTTNGHLFRGDKILHEWVNYFVENRAEDANFVRVCYGGEAEKEHAEKLVRLLKKKADLEDDQIQFVHIGPIIASHTGSTVLAIFFKQKDNRA